MTTSQVAALNTTHRGRDDLASYDTRRGVTHRGLGRPPLGRVDGLEAGDVVTADQMRLLSADLIGVVLLALDFVGG